MDLKHLIDSRQFTRELLVKLFKLADELRENPKPLLQGKVLATLFYESSTRTRLSFEGAMNKLGGKVISTENASEFSSAVKGESIEDTVRTIGGYADCIIIRHSEDNTALIASEVSPVPIINAGSGKSQHPSQALLDVYTIYREFRRLNNLKIAMIGDLANGRTVRSLSYLLGKFENIEIIFVSPENLKIPQGIKDYLIRKGVKYSEVDELKTVLPEVDIVYMTRIQKERMEIEDYEKSRGKFVINSDNLNLIKEGSIIMHPLPHVEEIDIPLSVEQNDDRVCYFRQAKNGLYVRMALLAYMLGDNSYLNK